MRAIHNNENSYINIASLAHRVRNNAARLGSLQAWLSPSNGYRRTFHSYEFHRNRQENTHQIRQTRNNKSPTLMARMRVLKNPRHLFFLSGFLASLGTLIAFLLVADKSQLAELAIGLIQR